MNRNPILCAIDTPDIGRARALAAAVSGAVGGIKLGLEFFVANGPAAVRQMAGATPLCGNFPPNVKSSIKSRRFLSRFIEAATVRMTQRAATTFPSTEESS